MTTNNIIQDLLDKISPKEREWIDKSIEFNLQYEEFLQQKGYIEGTPTSHALLILAEYGFYPIAITYYYGEETFVFKTKAEAKKAYNLLEKKLEKITGWFYGEKSWQQTIDLESNEYRPKNIYKL